MQLAPGTVIAGRYRLERPLAAGGMGAVWVARHVALQTELAVKVMSTSSAGSTAARARFEREARAAASLRHANVVAVVDSGIEDDTPYLVMELLHGESLEERLARTSRLPLEVLVPIAAQIGRGLRKAHEAGIIHRDLKPGNVFLAREDDEEIVKILDFGIAKEIDHSLGEHTKTSELMGSPHYMSPEQLRSSKKTDVRSDLWSLGVVLYRALTGQIPFPGDTLAEVMVQVFSSPLPLPSQLVPGLSSAVDAYFQRALARDPAERFQSVREMIDAFSALVGRAPMPSTHGHDLPGDPKSTSQTRPAFAAPPIAAPARPQSSPDVTPIPSFSWREGTPNAAAAIPPARTSSPGAAAAIPPARTSAPGAPAAIPPARTSAPGPSAMLSPSAASMPVVPGGPTAPPVSLPGASPSSSLPAPRADARASGPPAVPGPASAERPDGEVRPAAPTRLPPLQAIVGGTVVAGLLLVLVLVFALRSPSDEGGPSAASSSATAEPTAPTPPTFPSASGSAGPALTPDEMAAAVPDETPVEIEIEEPPLDAGPTPLRPSTWKFIPKGHARLKVTAKGGSCKVTVNGIYQGTTPVDVIVESGKQRIYCRMPTGSTRSKEVRAPELKISKVEFEVKQ
ncbi:serine/threonine-protein kinase [Polyangium aurulentum]|uniref:serine/threonine-protein kinase n=1 Tax=Polyangium aurulentum TaxID=2567896 RepID=UPI0010ADDEC6|nr:serine/threonine-protein kinase [Polyangium aurulentum]UQA60320.1 protein kinase [Polyangium aurulentum]